MPPVQKKGLAIKKKAEIFLLTDAYNKSKGIHRVEEYIQLLELYSNKERQQTSVYLQHQFRKKDHLVININSEASSRRLTVAKAVEIIKAVQTQAKEIILVGSNNEKLFVDDVINNLENKQGVESVAGQTTLKQLCEVVASAKLMLSTDSGPAHLANALGTQTVVLFGAGNEHNTAPYNKEAVETIRLGKLSCEPCMKNICVQFGTPQCLELLETDKILAAIKQKHPSYGD